MVCRKMKADPALIYVIALLLDALHVVVGALLPLIFPRNAQNDTVATLGARAGPIEVPGDSIQYSCHKTRTL